MSSSVLPQDSAVDGEIHLNDEMVQATTLVVVVYSFTKTPASAVVNKTSRLINLIVQSQPNL